MMTLMMMMMAAMMEGSMYLNPQLITPSIHTLSPASIIRGLPPVTLLHFTELTGTLSFVACYNLGSDSGQRFSAKNALCSVG